MHNPLVTYEKFAEVSCMGGFAFGVKTSCDECDFKLNGCVRKHIEESLSIVEAATERLVGFSLSKRYHVEEFFWDGESRVALSNAGISALNVRQALDRFEEGVAVSPYVLESATVTGNIVSVPRSLGDNPGNLFFRHSSTNGVIEQLYEDGYPKINGDNWDIKIDMSSGTVNVQHCKYMKVTIDTPSCEGEVFAVHPGTETIIPFAKPPVVDDVLEQTTYWFYAWSMVNPAFKYDETIDLEAGHFYKLEQEIDFICATEVEALPQVMCNRSGCEDDLEFADDENMVLTSLRDNLIDVYQNRSGGCRCSSPIKLRIYYKSDPLLVIGDLDGIAKAIVYLVASELPLNSCNCPTPENGFIQTAQKSYAQLKINQVTGAQAWQLAYGNRHGQMVYAEQMQKVPKKKRMIVIPS